MVHHPDSSLLFSGKVRPALPPHRLNRRLDCRSGKEDCGAKADGECRVSQNRYGEAQMLGWLLPFPLLSFPPLSFASVSSPFRSFVPFTFLPCLEGLGRKVRGGRAEPRGRQDAQKKDWPIGRRTKFGEQFEQSAREGAGNAIIKEGGSPCPRFQC